MKKHGFLACVALTGALMLGGCSAPKNITYFQDLTENTTLTTQPEQAIRLRPGDKVSIVVNSKDPSLASLFNLPIITSRGGTGSSYNGTGSMTRSYSGNNDGISSYTISQQGTINFPVLGVLKVAGMTRHELAKFIQDELIHRDLVKDPTVTVEYLNTGVNVLGEVGSPGRYDMNKDKLTLLDALALAGDMTINGRRDAVRVLRTENGKTQVYLIDMMDAKSMFNSPAFYLQQDDVVYVEPNDYRKRMTTVNGNQSLSASFWISVVSVCSSLAVLVVNLVQK